ncbi:MAG: hypothetical protein P8H97_05720 [Pseudomonadales bacterium]|nr:hypothetical protein [Pseudomonadales bacterium]MDG2035994.1 hypothetical protein [Pseudomonadales bacterium]
MLKKIILAVGKLLLIACILLGCQSDIQLMSFANLGCSSALNPSELASDEWCGCCVEHDIAYWRGGSSMQREQADERLRDCVQRTSRNEVLADSIYKGVRDGSSKYFFADYQWAYGWSFDRSYKPLNEKEQHIANQYLLDYFKGDRKFCL